jgi:hypothetical protein
VGFVVGIGKNMAVKKICNCRLGMLAGLAALAVITAFGAWLIFWFGSSGRTGVSVEARNWKNFKEDIYGLSIDYPAGWAFDINYDRYAAGLMGVEMNNKKCDLNSGRCDAGCADVRVLIGKKPENGQGQGLFTQLYEDFMMVRDFSTASLVNTLDLTPKKVFRVDNGAVTAALNGACSGPFYVFEIDSGHFAYVFAGYGAGAAAVTGEVEKIIKSISINH